MENLAHVNGFDSHFHLASLDFGEVEEAINEVQKTLSVIEQILQIFLLQQRELPFSFAPN